VEKLGCRVGMSDKTMRGCLNSSLKPRSRSEVIQMYKDSL
jgi:hypothetical protein